MLDIKFVRENPEIVKENIRKKFQDAKLPLVDEVIGLDAQLRAVKTEADSLRANRNTLSRQIGILMGQAKKDPSKKEEAEAVKAQVQAQAQRLAELEAQEPELEARIRKIMLTIPNRISRSPTTPRSWRASTGWIWTRLAGSPATASITSWGTSPGSTRRCWPTPGIS